MTLGDRHRVADLRGGWIACVCGWEAAAADYGRAYLAHCQHLMAVAQGREPDRPERLVRQAEPAAAAGAPGMGREPAA